MAVDWRLPKKETANACSRMNDCSVQPVKPQQCREFPNHWNFPGFEKTCHAISRVSDEQHRQLIAKTANGN